MNNLPDLPVQVPGPDPSHPVQIIHHRGAVDLNQDVRATQVLLESLQGKENSLHLEKVYKERRLITQPHPTCHQRIANRSPPMHPSGCIRG